MTYEEIRAKYGIEVLDKIFDVMFNAPVHDLIEDILIRMGDEELDNWVKIIKKTMEEV